MKEFLLIAGALVIGVVGLFLPKIARGKTNDEGIPVPTLNPTVTSGPSQSTDPAQPAFVPPSGVKGLRNNNPFNIEFHASINWVGQVGSDGRFAVFDKPINGIRAGMINIHTKMIRDGLTSVRQIITRLSPPSENPTEAFIAFVAQKTGVSPDQPMTFATHIIAMSKAIVQFENGQNPYPDSLYQQALIKTGKIG